MDHGVDFGGWDQLRAALEGEKYMPADAPRRPPAREPSSAGDSGALVHRFV